eukprot:COSAG03_NODE_276_length_9556_cov_8.462360_5_plen_115_part_00
MNPTRAATNSDGPTEITGRAMSPDDAQDDNNDDEFGSDYDGPANSLAEHDDVGKLRRQAGIEPSTQTSGTSGKSRGKASGKGSKGRAGGRGGRRGRGRGGPIRLRPPKNLSPIA